MAALNIERKTPKLGQDTVPSFATNGGRGVAAGAKIYSGAIIVKNATGFAAPGSTATGLICLGIAEVDIDNTGGADGAKTIAPRQGCFKLDNSASADLIGIANIGVDCFIVDDHTVALTNGSATRSRCGKIFDVDSDGGVWVMCGIGF